MVKVGDVVSVSNRRGPWVAVGVDTSPNGSPIWTLQQNDPPLAPRWHTAPEAALTRLARPRFKRGQLVLHNGEWGKVIADEGEIVRVAFSPRHKFSAARVGNVGTTPCQRGELIAANLEELLR